MICTKGKHQISVFYTTVQNVNHLYGEPWVSTIIAHTIYKCQLFYHSSLVVQIFQVTGLIFVQVSVMIFTTKQIISMFSKFTQQYQVSYRWNIQHHEFSHQNITWQIYSVIVKQFVIQDIDIHSNMHTLTNAIEYINHISTQCAQAIYESSDKLSHTIY